MRKIAATYIFTPEKELLKNGIIVCEDDGTIIEIIKTDNQLKEQSGLEFYSGILVPGFVNAHCQLELSYLKGKIKKHTGIREFQNQVNKLRQTKPQDFETRLRNLDRKMWSDGIAAVGDFSTTAETTEIKAKSKIFYHTFIEEPEKKSTTAEIAFHQAQENQLLLIHKTVTQKWNLEELKQHRNLESTFLVLCPNSTQYITNQLPQVELLRNEQLNICVGTGSLASNESLSILSELIALQNHFPEIAMEELLSWATINGAKALNIQDKFGNFEPKKNPGINLITGIDFRFKKFNSKSKLKRLI